MWESPLVLCFQLQHVQLSAATKHIEFASQEMRILEERVPPLSGLSGTKPFPVSYALNRERYALRLRVDETSYLPAIVVSIQADVPMSLGLITAPSAPDGNGYCFSYTVSGKELKLTWLDRENCVTQHSIKLALKNSDGVNAAVEDLSFNVIPNGRYCVEDAL